ncbi:hypothetical protein MPH_05343 [Macrophomina phaseolina MS6]|uniref:Uncharacterized protein n=1 Tax=Macrophomina phaseolina (strain MS6) TaxID=1126212 RepID=K2RXG3_MACPH|nr:hypothetical protein MPH_05343 [Macrophomina phaseolina MS6]
MRRAGRQAPHPAAARAAPSPLRRYRPRRHQPVRVQDQLHARLPLLHRRPPGAAPAHRHRHGRAAREGPPRHDRSHVAAGRQATASTGVRTDSARWKRMSVATQEIWIPAVPSGDAWFRRPRWIPWPVEYPETVKLGSDRAGGRSRTDVC